MIEPAKSPESSQTLTTAEALVSTLQVHGVDTIYGLPGFHNDPLFDEFYRRQDSLRVIHTRHEQAAGYMALGAALATGKPQVCCVVPGPGFLNAASSILTANGLNQPVLALVGQIPDDDIDKGYGHLHEIRDQVGLAGHLTKFAKRISRAEDVVATTSQAFQTACSGRKGPVMIEIALDVWKRSGPVSLPSAPLPLIETPVDLDGVRAAVKLLSTAKRPMIIVGSGAMDAGEEIIALAELLEAPIGYFRGGIGVVPTTHRLVVNYTIEYRLWAEADAVIAIGTRLFLQQAMWGNDDNLKIVRIDIDPEEPARFRKPEVAIVGDAKQTTAALVNELQMGNVPRPSREAEIAQQRAWLAQRLERLEPQMSYLHAMREALPADGIFVDEVTQLGFAGRLAFPVYKPRTYFNPGYQDNLGYGFGTALGIKSARPDTPVLAIAGDGGFMYQMPELATAKHHGINLVVVVYDNGLFGNVRRIQQEHFGNRLIASDLTNPDFVKLAEAFGIAAFRANTPHELTKAISDAFALNAPALIHVPCTEMPSPWDMILMPKTRGLAPSSTGESA